VADPAYGLIDYTHEEFLRASSSPDTLSTVRDADQIVVLDRGRIVELGTNTELVSQRGACFRVVRNQLELEPVLPKGVQLHEIFRPRRSSRLNLDDA